MNTPCVIDVVKGVSGPVIASLAIVKEINPRLLEQLSRWCVWSAQFILDRYGHNILEDKEWNENDYLITGQLWGKFMVNGGLSIHKGQ